MRTTAILLLMGVAVIACAVDMPDPNSQVNQTSQALDADGTSQAPASRNIRVVDVQVPTGRLEKPSAPTTVPFEIEIDEAEVSGASPREPVVVYARAGTSQANDEVIESADAEMEPVN
jgi:hypothetical protein